MDENGELIERAARDAVDQFDQGAAGVLRERAEIADHIGDELSAQTWRDVANAVDGLLAPPTGPLH